MTSSLSVIVPVRDHARELKRCLEAIRVSARGRKNIDLLVVDSGSMDDSPEVARRADAPVLDNGPGTAAQARNAGASATRGDLLAFIDADILIGPGWIDAALDAFDDPNVAAAGARPFAPPDANWVQEGVDLLRPHPEARRDAHWLPSGNCVIRRQMFEQVGGFDSTFETCEDFELSLRLRRHGFLLLDEPKLESVHLGDPRTLRGVFFTELWRGKDNLRVTLRATHARDMVSGVLPAVELAALVLCLGPSKKLRRGALGFVGSMVALRALRMVYHSRPARWRLMPTALAVAGAYELSRAAAMALPAPYFVRRLGSQRLGSRRP